MNILMSPSNMRPPVSLTATLNIPASAGSVILRKRTINLDIYIFGVWFQRKKTRLKKRENASGAATCLRKNIKRFFL